MIRLHTFVAALAFLPALVGAQQAPPRPVPPVPPAPPQVPAKPVPPLPVLPRIVAPVDIAPMIFDRHALDAARMSAAEALASLDVQHALLDAQAQMATIDLDRLHLDGLAAATLSLGAIDTHALADQAREAAMDAQHAFGGVTWPSPFEHDFEFDFGQALGQTYGQQGDGGYSSGMSALGSRQYDRAITSFDRTIARKAAQADAALYWKAFAQFKLGRSSDALESLAQLRREYAQSRYLADARVLEADARRSSGQPVNPAAMDDDEIKLIAISGIQRSDPARAIPLLEGVLSATNSLNVKKRALYVLALSDQPRAHEILMSYAKGGGTPDLQRVAIEYIASRRDRQTTSADLREIYDSTTDLEIRMAIINAYAATGDKPAILAIVSNGSAPVELRTTAVSGLTRLASPQDVWSLYQKETNADLRSRMLGVLSSMQAADLLIQAARAERDAAVRQRAVSYLGRQKAEVTGQTLVDLYSTDQDVNVRKAIISALSSQENAAGLVAVARKENTIELTRDIVSRLSNMAGKSKVAADYLMEIIKR